MLAKIYQGKTMMAILDDLYAQREIRIYKDYAPTLRSERYGLKVLYEDRRNKQDNKSRLGGERYRSSYE